MGIPQVPPTDNRELHRFLIAIKEILETRYTPRGTYRDISVSLGMLVDAGVITDAQARVLAENP